MKTKETNPLDLNNFPIDHCNDGQQQAMAEDTAFSGNKTKKKKKNGDKGESEKIYECRFCSLKFGKSQALGGHMNRHRQERETETLIRARQIVNENLAAHGAPQLGSAHPNAPGCFHRTGPVGDPALPYRPVYPTRMFPGSPSTVLPPLPCRPYACPSCFISHPLHAMTDHCVGHVLMPNQSYGNRAAGPNYTYIGAPVGPGFPPGAAGVGSVRPGSGSDSGLRDGSLQTTQ